MQSLGVGARAALPVRQLCVSGGEHPTAGQLSSTLPFSSTLLSSSPEK